MDICRTTDTNMRISVMYSAMRSMDICRTTDTNMRICHAFN
jgi:hypothetical protein